MKRDILFFLPPGFLNHNVEDGKEGGRHEYCPECAELWGILSWFPDIQDSLKVEYQPIDKPRPDMVAMLGEAHQNCPTLVLAKHSPVYDNCGILQHQGHRFINNARDVGRYYAMRFGTPWPRGS